MKKTVNFSLIFVAIISLLCTSCKKKDIPVLTTLDITNILATSASSGGNITDDGNADVTARGVCWATTGMPTIINSHSSDGSGSGNFTSSITGLTGGTLYHVRAYATNKEGTAYGADKTFTTLGTFPSATTLDATGIQLTGATLNGTVNANYLSTTISFEYGTTTSYGSSTAATPATATGNASTSVTANLTSLTSGTLYHFRVKTVNAIGTAYGSDKTFTTLGQAPSATTLAATNLLTTGATLNGTVNANELSTTVTFEYGLTASYGSTTAATPGTVTGTISTSVSSNITGLNPGTVYHFRVKAVNTLGTTTGNDLTFTTAGQAPTATTEAATNILTTGGTINATINANAVSTTVSFEYGSAISYGNTAAATPGTVTGTTNTGVTANLSGLAPGTLYHFRVKAVNSVGTTYGNDMTFTTGGGVPSAVTLAATSVQGFSATANGTVNANDVSTTVTFEYGTTTSYGNSAAAAQNPVTGTADVSVSAGIAGLSPATLYHFRMKAVNSIGTTYGDDLTFITLGQVPYARIKAATNVLSTSATLNGTVNADDLSTTVIFEYGLTTSYGSTATAAQSPVSGNTNLSVSSDITGLSPATTYYFRIKADNVLGTTYSNGTSLTTGAK